MNHYEETLEEVMPNLESLFENKEVPEDLRVIIRHDFKKAQHAKLISIGLKTLLTA